MIFYAVLGFILIVVVLVDAFETIILPRRVSRRFRLARIFYKTFWKLWIKEKKLIKDPNKIKAYLGTFGPLSLIILIGIWAILLIFGFSLINYGLQIAIEDPTKTRGFLSYFLVSGGTFFPVELVDTYTLGVEGKLLAIIEGGVGFAFLAMVIGYLPVLYQAFSRREVNINLLDSHAGSPPNALYMLQQLSKNEITEELKSQLQKWELWCAELLETHLSYPVLAYYRSQHDDQSWVAALLMILDASTIVLASNNTKLHSFAKSTFAIARHASADLTQAFFLTPHGPHHERLSKQDLAQIRKLLANSDFSLKEGNKAEEKLLLLRKLYEPQMQALSDYFHMPITPFILQKDLVEAWRKDI